MSQIPFLSVIIPVFNEESRLNALAFIYKYLDNQKFSSELVVVNDGSSDRTLKKLQSLSKKIPFKIISYTNNRGKGFAIKQGILNSTGKYRLFMDIDLSTPIEEWVKFYPEIKRNDVVIGSRRLKNSNLIVRQPFVREWLGRGFTFLSRIILQLSISDFTCGFKCFSKKEAEEIFSRQKIERWGFDSEILFIANKLKFSIKEIPVKWENDLRTRVKFPKDLIISLAELIKIRFYNFMGKYDEPSSTKAGYFNSLIRN